jgi:glutamate racemase
LKTVGVFDSGVGGLSVLQALRAEMPGARFIYVADSAHAPYGERSSAQVSQRAQRIAEALIHDHGIDALVVACNTATAHAIEALRERHPGTPIVGVEPALRPAAATSRSGHVGVLATRGTVQSDRFARLLREVKASSADRPVRFSIQACDGLADAIERQDSATTRRLCKQYVSALRQQAGDIDTVVLGCTHYPFAGDVLRDVLGPDVKLMDTGEAVARRTRAVLGLQASAEKTREVSDQSPPLTLLSTGSGEALARSALQWLGITAPVQHLNT